MLVFKIFLSSNCLLISMVTEFTDFGPMDKGPRKISRKIFVGSNRQFGFRGFDRNSSLCLQFILVREEGLKLRYYQEIPFLQHSRLELLVFFSKLLFFFAWQTVYNYAFVRYNIVGCTSSLNR